MGSASSSLKKCNSSPCALLSTTISGGLDVPPELRAMADKRVRVHNATHYRSGPKYFHDFIVLEATLIVAGRNSDLKFMIRAEKYKDPAQIKVSLPLFLEDDDTMIVKYGPAEIGEEILMKDLLNILTEESADYNLLSNNCWSYADSTFKKLIKKLADSNQKKRERLKPYLNNPSPLMPDEAVGSSSALFLGGVAMSILGSGIVWLVAKVVALVAQYGGVLLIQGAVAKLASVLAVGSVPVLSLNAFHVVVAVGTIVVVPSLTGVCLLGGGICFLLLCGCTVYCFVMEATPRASRRGGIAPLSPAEGLPPM